LYEYCSNELGRAIGAGQHVLIVSGGYGLLLAGEPIGTYERRFALSDWPFGLIEECIIDYARHEGIRSVIAVMSNTTDYAKIIRRVKFRNYGFEAKLVSPVSVGGGAMVKVPRAQGQAIASLITAGLHPTWRSSDSLDLEIRNL
jgi:hypothetical protein